jgi:glycerophosphoryl diester phosphodiesterase
MVCSRYWPSVDALARLPFVQPILSARNRVELARLRQRLAVPPESAGATRTPYGVSVHRTLLDEKVVAELHRNVEVVMTWPINDRQSLDNVLAIGVTGVISDDFDVLRILLDGQA